MVFSQRFTNFLCSISFCSARQQQKPNRGFTTVVLESLALYTLLQQQQCTAVQCKVEWGTVARVASNDSARRDIFCHYMTTAVYLYEYGSILSTAAVFTWRKYAHSRTHTYTADPLAQVSVLGTYQRTPSWKCSSGTAVCVILALLLLLDVLAGVLLLCIAGR